MTLLRVGAGGLLLGGGLGYMFTRLGPAPYIVGVTLVGLAVILIWFDLEVLFDGDELVDRDEIPEGRCPDCYAGLTVRAAWFDTGPVEVGAWCSVCGWGRWRAPADGTP